MSNDNNESSDMSFFDIPDSFYDCPDVEGVDRYQEFYKKFTQILQITNCVQYIQNLSDYDNSDQLAVQRKINANVCWLRLFIHFKDLMLEDPRLLQARRLIPERIKDLERMFDTLWDDEKIMLEEAKEIFC